MITFKEFIVEMRDSGDDSKREFKKREMEHELGHENRAEKESGNSSHAVHVNGKKWKSFATKSHAQNVANKIKGATVHKEEYVDDSHGFVQEGADQKKPTLPPHLLKLIKDKQLDKKPMSQTSKVKDVTPKGYGPNEETNPDKFKKYIRPVVKTTPKIERDTNPSGRTTDHVEWKVTTHTGEIVRHKSKKEAQAHFDSLPK